MAIPHVDRGHLHGCDCRRPYSVAHLNIEKASTWFRKVADALDAAEIHELARDRARLDDRATEDKLSS